MSYRERIGRPGPKRLLALDGGGIRGVLAIEILGAGRSARTEMLLVSVGTGSLMTATDAVKASQMTLLYNARHIPSALLNAASVEQDLLCRVVGRCRFGEAIDREIGPLTAVDSDADALVRRKFTYVRYTPELTQTALDALGLADINALDVQPLLSAGHVEELQRVGKAYAQQHWATSPTSERTPLMTELRSRRRPVRSR